MEMPMSGSILPTFLIIYLLQPSLRVRFELSSLCFTLIYFMNDTDNHLLLYHRFSVCMGDFLHLWIH